MLLNETNIHLKFKHNKNIPFTPKTIIEKLIPYTLSLTYNHF